MKKAVLPLLIICIGLIVKAQDQPKDHIIQMVFTSDVHYGISRNEFRGDTSVSAHLVNKAMVEKINSLPAIILPKDGGMGDGKSIGYINYVIEGGDIANRMEIPNLSASNDWKEFEADYINGIHLTDQTGKPSSLLIIPGNHDISNAVGFYKPMQPVKDPTSMVQIYNLMMHPAELKTNSTYQYPADMINYSKTIGGIHCMFINLWPDSLERIWMEKDINAIDNSMPVIIFAHDEPECEAKHFTNPNAGHSINKLDAFENLLAEVYKDGGNAKDDGNTTNKEQYGWVAFLKKHPNVKAYFHGNSNYNEFYTYHGPDNNMALPIFRVDSPIKGKYSKNDETKLSFQLISIDAVSKKITVRECLWNSDPAHPEKPVQWGESKTISF